MLVLVPVILFHIWGVKYRGGGQQGCGAGGGSLHSSLVLRVLSITFNQLTSYLDMLPDSVIGMIRW